MPTVGDRAVPLRTGRWHRREPLAGDASRRRYTRVAADGGSRTAILAEYGREAAATIGRDIEVLHWCRAHGLRVPDILESRSAAGWMVVEDFGLEDAATTLRKASGPERLDLLRRTIPPLATLAGLPPRRLPGWNPPLDEARLRFELAGFQLWYVRHLRGASPTLALSEYLDSLAAAVAAHPASVCHRDFHLNNLFFLIDGGVGIIDIQDILVGPDTYDAASLLEERDTPELLAAGEAEQWLEEWADMVGAVPGYRRRFAEARLQRALKVLGTFARLLLEGRTRYRPWLTALEARLRSAAGELGLPSSLTALLVD